MVMENLNDEGTLGPVIITLLCPMMKIGRDKDISFSSIRGRSQYLDEFGSCHRTEAFQVVSLFLLLTIGKHT